MLKNVLQTSNMVFGPWCRRRPCGRCGQLPGCVQHTPKTPWYKSYKFLVQLLKCVVQTSSRVCGPWCRPPCGSCGRLPGCVQHPPPRSLVQTLKLPGTNAMTPWYKCQNAWYKQVVVCVDRGADLPAEVADGFPGVSSTPLKHHGTHIITPWYKHYNTLVQMPKRVVQTSSRVCGPWCRPPCGNCGRLSGCVQHPPKTPWHKFYESLVQMLKCVVQTSSRVCGPWCRPLFGSCGRHPAPPAQTSPPAERAGESMCESERESKCVCVRERKCV